MALTASRLAPSILIYPSAAAIAAALIMPPAMMLYSTPLAVAGTAGLIAASREGQHIYRVLTFGPVVFVGLISYSLYLWHWPVLAVARWTVGIDVWNVVPLICIIAALAVTSYYLVEKPLRGARWSSSRPVTIGYGLASATIISALALSLSQGAFGNLYQREPAQLIASGVGSLKDKKFYKGQLQWDPANCVLDTKDTNFAPVTIEKCSLTGATNTDRTFLVIGNSFSAALYEMYAHLSNAGYGQVVATSTWGASQTHTLPNTGPWASANAHYWQTVIPALITKLEPGDVILMLNDNAGYFAQQPQNDELIRQLRSGLDEISALATQQGLDVVYLNQISLTREAKCTPDMAKSQWLDTSLKLCTFYDSAYTRGRLSLLTESLAQIAQEHPNFHVLDLSAVYCPGSVCEILTPTGVPLYRDEFSHPSVEANILAQPVLVDLVRHIDQKNGRHSVVATR